jgi:putative phosphoesterase
LKFAVLADTHIPHRARALPQRAYDIIEKTDAIIHAGDITSVEFLDELAKLKPLHAVLGNNDFNIDVPKTLNLEIAGIEIAVVHETGSKEGRARRLSRRFPNARVVVFGHSHIPLNEEVDGLLLFNPGSATDRRRQPHHTMGILTIAGGQVLAEIVPLD